MPRMRITGIALCLGSAAAFGAMGIFGKLAYEQGSTVATLLSTRFILAALVLWALLAATGGVRRLRALGRRDVLLALALGAVGYGAQAGCYFAALDRMDASLLALVLYTYPAMVALAAIALGRERASARTAGALVLAAGGLALVLTGAAAGSLEATATALGLGAATVYTVYILTSEGIASRADALPLATLVCTGAAVTLTAAGLLTGGLDPAAVTAPGWLWLAALAVVSTVGAIALFFAGLRIVGPTAAAILSTLEPVTTVVLAAVVFGESLGPAQLAGGVLVLGAALAVRVPDRTDSSPHGEVALGRAA